MNNDKDCRVGQLTNCSFSTDVLMLLFKYDFQQSFALSPTSSFTFVISLSHQRRRQNVFDSKPGGE